MQTVEELIVGLRYRKMVVDLFFIMILSGAAVFGRAAAEEMPVFSIQFNDGTIAPLRLEVPAGRPFKIELHNTGKTPAEFESTELHLEKVLAAQSSSFIVIRRLGPGEHKFFDDFHPGTPQAVLVAK
jgi:hypothetical protein